MPEEQALTMHVILKILVLILTDMVWLKVCKHTNIKCKSRNPVKHKSL